MDKLPTDVLRQHIGKSFVGVGTAAAICNQRGQLFLAKRSVNARDEHGRWDICGGGLEWNKTIEDNLRTEIAEEFGVVSTSPLKFIGVREAHRVDEQGEKTHWVSIDHVIVLNDEEEDQIRINEPEKFDDSGWFPLDDLPQPLHSVIDQAFINKIKSAL